MRIVLSLLILLLVASHIFTMDLSLAPGLSAKNAVLYVATVFIAFRIAVSGNFKMQMGSFIGSYVMLIVYAIATWLVAGLVIHYKSYEMMPTGITLKNILVDPLIFFLTFLFGARNSEDSIKIIKVLLIACILANIATLGDAFSLFSLGDYTEPGSNGRMAGPLGEANQYGVYIAIFLPPMCAAMALARGLMRWLWLAAIGISVATLLTTASRGALVAVLLSSIWGVYLMRNYLSSRKIVSWVARGVAAGVVIVAVVSIEFGDLLRERLIGESKAVSIGALSSGRSEFWMDAIDKMMTQPLSLLTGFGWDSYSTMGFHYTTHNHYLSLWFNLGLPGLILGVLLFVILVREAQSALAGADHDSRVYLMAFIFSVLSLVISIFFVEIFTPWPYFWAYAGVAIRLALSAKQMQVPDPVRSTQRIVVHG